MALVCPSVVGGRTAGQHLLQACVADVNANTEESAKASSPAYVQGNLDLVLTEIASKKENPVTKKYIFKCQILYPEKVC